MSAPNPRLQRTRSAPLRSPLSRKPLGVTHQSRWRLLAGLGIAAFLALAALPVACVHSSSATVEQVGAERELVLRETETGLFVGPCAAPGRSESKYWIRLKGEGPLYSPAQLEFVDAKGVSWPKDKDLQGEIRFDAAHHRVMVNLHVRGEALAFNGSYRYRVTK